MMNLNRDSGNWGSPRWVDYNLKIMLMKQQLTRLSWSVTNKGTTKKKMITITNSVGKLDGTINHQDNGT